MQIADTTPGPNGLDAVVNAATVEKNQRPGGMVEHALMLFILHHPQGRTLRIPVSSPDRPDKSSPLPSLSGSGRRPRPGIRPRSQSSSTPPEHRLDWFREDPLANEHHQHWHVVYPRGAFPAPTHAASKIATVSSFSTCISKCWLATTRNAWRLRTRACQATGHNVPIAEGYDPGGLVTLNRSGGFTEYAARPRESPCGISRAQTLCLLPIPFTTMSSCAIARWMPSTVVSATATSSLRLPQVTSVVIFRENE